MTPGEAEVARAELDRAARALHESKVLVDASSAEGATSRLYYAVFHAARAALAVRGLYAKTHSGQITLFERTFGEAPVLGRLFDLRAKADYGREQYAVSPESLADAILEAEAFLERCRGIVAEALAEGPDEPDPPPDF